MIKLQEFLPIQLFPGSVVGLMLQRIWLIFGFFLDKHFYSFLIKKIMNFLDIPPTYFPLPYEIQKLTVTLRPLLIIPRCSSCL